MAERVPSEHIERIVGVQRHPLRHYARAVSSEQTVYVLHSHVCLESGRDLLECPYTLALEHGIDEYDWSDVEDQAVHVVIKNDRLIPKRT